MNKNNTINRKYEANKNVLKKASPNYKNIYSSYFNVSNKDKFTIFECVKHNIIKNVK